MSHLMSKPIKWHVPPATTQISLGIRPVWSESSLCTQWVAKDPSFLHANREDSDQTGRMPRLIGVIAGLTCHFVGFVTRRLSHGLFQVSGLFNGILFHIGLLTPVNYKLFWTNAMFINFNKISYIGGNDFQLTRNSYDPNKINLSTTNITKRYVFMRSD